MGNIPALFKKPYGKTLIKGVDLQVNSGELALLMGLNGSGKSTLLHATVGDKRYRDCWTGMRFLMPLSYKLIVSPFAKTYASVDFPVLLLVLLSLFSARHCWESFRCKFSLLFRW